MPTYVYRCLSCQKSFELQARMSDAPPTRGPDCASESGAACRLEKAPSRVYGYVAGAKPPPAPRPEARAQGKEAANEASHICSKYCDLHGGGKGLS